MYEELLRACGLTQNESIVYLTLLKIGKSKSGVIVKEARISGGKIYETLYKLIDKGLVQSITENGVKHFIANDPKTLLAYIKEKEQALRRQEEELEHILPDLATLQKKDDTLETVALIKTIKGLKPIIYDCLERSKDSYVLGVRSSKDKKFNTFWKQWHSYRASLKKHCRMLFSDKDTDYWKFMKKLKHTEVREMLSFTPSATAVIGNDVFILSYKKTLSCIHIHSKDVAESFNEFFNGLWETAAVQNKSKK